MLLHRLTLVAAAALALVACGGEQTAGIQGTGAPVATTTSVGPISGFGSIIQDGVEYQTTSAQISVEDQPGNEALLHVGQVVTIKGTVNADGTTGVATEVSFTADARGPVGQVDVNAQTFTVLGQTVRVIDSTLFDDALQATSVDALAGIVVEVSGTANAAGEIVASRIQPAANNSGFQVKGQVQSLDTTAHTFRINALTVDYSNAAPTGGTFTSGSNVLVRGTGVSNGVFAATQVRVLGPLVVSANDKGRVDGIITAYTSNADFKVGSQRITTDSTTVFTLGGATLGVDVPVRVSGTFNASGALAASSVEVKPKDLSIVRGLVDAVSATGKTLTVLGVSISTNTETSFDDHSSPPVKHFSLADVRTGDYVEVRGVPGTGKSLVAALVERDKPEDRVYLQGLAVNLATPNFTVIGVQVMTNAQTKFTALGGLQFFNDASGHVVRVRGTLSGAVLVADQVQIKH